MVSRKKKSEVTVKQQADDMLVIKKSELVKKLKTFLEEENACNGDWVNKVRVKLLGEEMKTFDVKLRFETTITMDIPSSGIPSQEEVCQLIEQQLADGDLDFDIDYEDFEIMDIKES